MCLKKKKKIGTLLFRDRKCVSAAFTWKRSLRERRKKLVHKRVSKPHRQLVTIAADLHNEDVKMEKERKKKKVSQVTQKKWKTNL